MPLNDRLRGVLMRHVIAISLVVASVVGFLATQLATFAEASGQSGLLLTIDDAITPLEAKRFTKAIEQAGDESAELLIVQLSTPGGLFDSTREIVEGIFASPVPVVVYVSPAGARAASAGTFIAAASHVAAMAPATNIGAASPVSSGGDDLPETIKAKATEDASAFLRSIAAQRNRNADALQATVVDARSYTAEEALSLRVVDLNADSMADLLVQLHGMAIPFDGQIVELNTEGLNLTPIEKTPVDHFIGFLANPNVAFLLLTIGGIGIVIELFSPGLIGPGAVGVIALVLAFLAFGNLPVNWVAVGLILLAMALFYVEAQAPGIGIFGVAGAVAFLVGTFLLFGNVNLTPQVPDLPEAPDFRISLWIIGGMCAVLFGSMALTIRAVRQARRTPSYYDYSSGNPDNLVGTVGIVTSELSPVGSVRVAGEQWSAVSDSGAVVPTGERVMILDVEGLTLSVTRESEFHGDIEQ